MVKKKVSDIIPEQQSGKAIDAESFIELKDENEAKKFFVKVKDRLQNVNQWKGYAGNISANFQLVDRQGNDVQRKAEKGDYFKIDIPGPGRKSGNGYDWVEIEDEVSSSSVDSESFGFRVRPADNPKKTDDEVAHFYSRESTSTFVVERKNNKIRASVHDRNTKPNTDAERPSDKIRDALVGMAGAFTFSKIQWKNLTDGLLNP
jgi:hypothetical protein